MFGGCLIVYVCMQLLRDVDSHRSEQYAPSIAQPLVLGIRRVPHSTSQPRRRLNDESHMRNLESIVVPRPAKVQIIDEVIV